MTRSAMHGAFELGCTLDHVVKVIQSLTREHFYKSMTAHASSHIWQDVYYFPWGDIVLYVKFTADEDGKLLISFKER